MPAIISSTKLRNEYNEVSKRCHESAQPIFVTKNGEGDLAIMSMETFDMLTQYASLSEALAIGHADVETGRHRPAQEALADLREELGL